MNRIDVMLLALGWVLVIEGLMPMLAPGFWKEAVRRVAEQSDARCASRDFFSLCSGW